MYSLAVNNSKLELVQDDITEEKTDAIVNAANKRLAPGGGVAGAIHKAAGPDLWEECKKLNGCRTGEAEITEGYDLPANHVIHTVGPVYDGSDEDPKLLRSSYEESLKLAEENNLKSISFPALSTGAFGYPVKDAAQIALRTIIDYLNEGSSIDLVRFVLFSSDSYQVHEEVIRSLEK